MERNGGGGKSPMPKSSWLWTQGGQTKHQDNNGESASESHPPVHIDVFQEREGGNIFITPSNEDAPMIVDKPEVPRRGGGMRVGRDYQAKIPNVIPEADRNVQGENDRALLVWKPTEKLTDEDIEHYISMAKEKYQYTGEQALGLLYWHRYDVQRATLDLGNFTPHPEEWTIEDKVLFEQAFQFHGKCFDKIRQMLPDKSMSSLIRYYYNWKKHKNKSSVMDRQVKKLSSQEEEDSVQGTNGGGLLPIQSHQGISGGLQYHSVMGSNREGFHSESDDEKQTSDGSTWCKNCSIPCKELMDNLCNCCWVYYRNTGDSRPLTGPLRRGDKNSLGLLRQRRAPPKGMNINHDDLSMLARSQPQAENVILQGLEKEVLDMKCRIQNEKQRVELLRRGLPKEGVSHLKPRDGLCPPSGNRVNSRWTQDELMLAAQGIRRYGKNFQKIAEVIGTKTEAHIKSFYANYRRRYGLEALIQEHQLENEDDSMEETQRGQPS